MNFKSTHCTFLNLLYCNEAGKIAYRVYEAGYGKGRGEERKKK